ncbi:hypothetical protein BDP27DRAFT_1477842 [Rhodocollybia butyracea]|uniref:Uncharacterized protein n=1 Tax=Rhodocollybia butyracea TaxID=206335 RepID=A0A9P5PHS1_9AGAR|nr:hypothetical protein BDP27DRAFT_1477842 [Rhodocollybia butyracea]
MWLGRRRMMVGSSWLWTKEWDDVLTGDEPLRKGNGQLSRWQLGLLLTHPPSGLSFVLPNPLHKPSRKKIPPASPIYPSVSLKRSALNADNDAFVVLDLDKAYMQPWNLALYMDTTVNTTEGIRFVMEKEDNIYPTALKAIITRNIRPLQDHKLARRPRPHLSSPTSQEELDVFSGSTRVAPFLVLQMVKSSCAYPELIDGNPAAHLVKNGQ